MFRGVPRKVPRPLALSAIAAVGLIGIGSGTAYAVSVATAGPAQPAGTVYACVGAGGKLAYLETGKVPSACPSGDSLWKWSITGPKGATGPAGPTGPPGTGQPVTASAVTAVSDLVDVGNNGNWAVDTLTRSATVILHGAVSVRHCGGDAVNGITNCYFYTATLTDGGTFQTIPDAKSPNFGTTIHGILGGTVSGGSDFEFYATSNAPSASNVPGTDDASTSGDPSTADWPEVFFPEGTIFSGVNEINPTYTYTAPNTCEQWVNSYNNNYGSGIGDGDITGINHCGP